MQGLDNKLKPAKFTIEEIRKYILSQDSLGDILYNLKESNIIKANEKEDEIEGELDCPFDFTSRCTMGRCDCEPKK